MRSLIRYILSLTFILIPLQHYAVNHIFRNIAVAESMSDPVVNAIYKDKHGHIWIDTNTSIERYDSISLKHYAQIDIDTKGLSVRTIALNDDANTHVSNPAYNYPISITGIAVNGKLSNTEINKEKENIYSVSFDSSNKNITVFISGFTYTDPSSLSYEYKIDVIDHGWKSVSGRSEITYYDLPAGEYKLSIRTTGLPETEIYLYINIARNGTARINYLIIFLIIAVASCYFVFIRRRNHKYIADIVKRIMYPKEKLIVKAQNVDSSISIFENTNQGKPEKPKEEKYKSNKVSQDECKRLEVELQKLMNDQRLYTNPELKIGDLAASMNTSAHNLSYLFNQYLNCNYYDYINEYRIEEFKRLIEDEQSDKFTLTTIAMQCGFSSRASFFRYFKKATGMTPNEYVKSKESFKYKA